MNQEYDAIVIGAGLNGLVAAAYLRRAGMKVLVVERRQNLGGAAATQEVFPGFQVNTGSMEAGLFLPEIAPDLDLGSHGLELIHSPVLVHAPGRDGKSLTLWRDVRKTSREISRFSEQDARRYPQFVDQVTRFAAILKSIMTLTPPSLPDYEPGELLPWLRAAIRVKRLGDREMIEFLRTLPLSVSEYLDEWFESPALKAALGATGVKGSMLGPRGSGTAFMFLYQADPYRQSAGGVRASSFVRGGTGRLSEALAGAAQAAGAEVCLGMPVSDIFLDGDRVGGVVLESGERIRARAVLSSANPRHTFFDLTGAQHLPVRFVREVRNIRFRGSLARVNLALSDLPRFVDSGEPGGMVEETERLSGHILVCSSLDDMERAYDEAKFGQFSRNPCLDITIPTLLDPSLAPPGKHMMCIDVQYAPYPLEAGSWEEKSQQLGERVIEVLAEVAPDIYSCILDRQVLTPLDLEREYGLPEGCIYHGQMGLDQLLFMRPVAGYGNYKTPLEGLYLCGAGAHPGGGVTGAPGYNAAREVIKEIRRQR